VQEHSLADRTGVHRLPAATAPDAPLEVATSADGASCRIKNPASTLPRTLEHDAQYVRRPALPLACCSV
jgi:hypothetical protein